jgi:hypothetical protein
MGTVSMWGTYGERPQPSPGNNELFAALEVRAAVDVDCEASSAWALVSDIGRVAQLSPECIGARWVDGADGPRVGAHFEGTNRVGAGADEAVWIRRCTVTACEPDRLFAYDVGDRYDATVASTWTFEIEPFGDARCLIRQTFRHAPDGLSGLREIADADPAQAAELVWLRADDLQAGMDRTLQAMKAILEGEG